ncbi:MAG: hypothetical protein AB1553_15410, partial [Nitrospirota bacterium]
MRSSPGRHRLMKWCLTVVLLLFGVFLQSDIQAFTLNVVGCDQNNNCNLPVNGFRWLLEEDNTDLVAPGVPWNDPGSPSAGPALSIHKSHAPVITKGQAAGSSTMVDVPNTGRYVISVLPDAGFSNGGAVVAVGQDTVTVHVHQHPIPTAQISVLAFVDQNPINNGKDEGEQGLGGATVIVTDAFGGGPISQDVFGNPLGTRYNPDGSVAQIGSGVITTLTQADFDAGNNPDNLKVGEALVKYIAPGKYGIRVVPPRIDDSGAEMQWIQTTTIEGTPTIDAWVKANEPRLFVEGFGTAFNHVAFGFIKLSPTVSTFKGQTLGILPWNATPPTGNGSIQGTLRANHFARPPMNQGYFPGELMAECWVGLNNPLLPPEAPAPGGGPGEVFNAMGLYAAPCDANSHFVINNVPPGTYQLVWWDKPLDYLFGWSTVVVGPGQNVDLGNVLAFRWFGTLQGTVFYDADQDGFRDVGEPGLASQAVNIRFRDGSMYQATVTDPSGEYALSEVFPFFKWLVPEVDFARFKATGLTTVVDYGGQIPPANGWIMPSFDKLTPQPQVTPPNWPAGTPPSTTPVNNPNTGNNLSRTEMGPVLTQAMHLFLNQTNVIDWGKVAYGPNENGGITGIVYYDVTRAEDAPRYNAPEPWQPGIPNVTVNLYEDFNSDGIPDGAAIDSVTTDSWDANAPTGCIQELPVIHGQAIPPCADSYGTWNQMRPGVFDGGYAFGPDLPPGTYIVEVVPPPGYELVKEEDKNVDFGDEYKPSLLLLPPVCVGAPHTVPAELSLFPGVPVNTTNMVDIDPATPGIQRPLCDRKQVVVRNGQNTAADFYLFTEVPKAARAVGFVNNDLGAEFNMASPNFGEKLAAAWIPISFKDWAGKEIVRVYADEFGSYNALLPSTYTANIPSPSGFSPNMITAVLNDPIMADGSIDPFYNPVYSITPWTFEFMPGKTTYMDTPLIPMAAFSAAGTQLDTAPPSNTPVIKTVTGPEAGGGPVMCSSRTTGRTVTITGVSSAWIINPAYSPNIPGSQFRIQRFFGFGSTTGQVLLNGVAIPSANIQSWTNDTITFTVPAGATTGTLMVRRGDNNLLTEVGVTFNIVDCATTPIVHVAPPTPGNPTPIQDAIDAATVPGTLIIVGEGNYNENVVMNKPVILQGSGAGGTFIFGTPSPRDRLQAWHDRMNALGAREFAAFLLKDPFSESEAPVIMVAGQTEYTGGTLQNPTAEQRFFNQGNPFTTAGQARIDGFTLSGSNTGGGIFAVSGARYLVISNNNITGNSGNYAGGIAIGTQDVGFNSQNSNIIIRQNKIHKNGGIQGGGGIAMNERADNYLIEDNYIIGNFSRFNGGGINHRGDSLGENVIRRNRILFNEVTVGALIARAGDGGGIYIGDNVVAGTGTGNVTIDANLIQGNISGAGYGGGIRAFAVNGDDVRNSPDNDAAWYRLRIFNNIIVNNVAGLAGAGISLQDVARSFIINNTIANNDSTATSANAFIAGQLDSTPQPAGVISTVHSDALQGLFGAGLAETYANPVLVNNIIWHNRSFYNNHLLNGGAGGLAPNPTSPYWDLDVLGTTTQLNPQYCILSSTAGYAATNIATNPAFVSEYFNALQTATVLDEGGNNITVIFTPLTVSGDYHIQSTSPAVNSGVNTYLTQFAELRRDYDNQVRPGGTVSDRGADEVVAGGPTPPGAPVLYLSLFADQTIGGVAYANEDILVFDSNNQFSMLFDGSDVGVG